MSRELWNNFTPDRLKILEQKLSDLEASVATIVAGESSFDVVHTNTIRDKSDSVDVYRVPNNFGNNVNPLVLSTSNSVFQTNDGVHMTKLLTQVDVADFTTTQYVDAEVSGIEAQITDIEQAIAGLSSGTKYRGQVATEADLPSTGQELGDMYSVLDYNNTGQSVFAIWDGAAWDFTSTIDLTGYLTDAASDSKLYGRKNGSWQEFALPTSPSFTSVEAGSVTTGDLVVEDSTETTRASLTSGGSLTLHDPNVSGTSVTGTLSPVANADGTKTLNVTSAQGVRLVCGSTVLEVNSSAVRVSVDAGTTWTEVGGATVASLIPTTAPVGNPPAGTAWIWLDE